MEVFMNALECMKTRRSIRSFSKQPVSHEVLEEIVETARFAPSWKNTQIARYTVVEDKKLQKKIAEECVMGFSKNTETLTKAPVLVVLSYITKRSGFERDGSYSTAKGDAWEMFDAGIAAQTFCLVAHEKGLGTCIIGIFDETMVGETIHLPENQKIGAIIALGYPDTLPVAPPRKNVEQLLTFL